jgi:hypothetical protein
MSSGLSLSPALSQIVLRSETGKHDLISVRVPFTLIAQRHRRPYPTFFVRDIGRAHVPVLPHVALKRIDEVVHTLPSVERLDARFTIVSRGDGKNEHGYVCVFVPPGGKIQGLMHTLLPGGRFYYESDSGTLIVSD